jgi:hypothetical protein
MLFLVVSILPRSAWTLRAARDRLGLLILTKQPSRRSSGAPLKPLRLYADHCVTPAGPGKRANPRLRLKAIFGACA